ncbi:MAG: hypothetical protein EPO21_08680 [Chloroflexota bacterium]|nr:MAG: hypothetical protein EPO21_08680 [Chloroflexota bacterium]
MMLEADESSRTEERQESREREIAFTFRIPRLIPREAKVHLRAARREMLLAVRSMLDCAIDRLEEREQESQTRTTKIDIQ